MIADVSVMIFSLLAQHKVEDMKSHDKVQIYVDQRLQFMRTLIETLYDLWFESFPHHTLSEGEMVKILSALTATMSSLKESQQAKGLTGSYFNEDQKTCYLQLW